jgi:hypothetical protein
MAIDVTITPGQRKLQFEARKFANELLAGASAAELRTLLCLGASHAGSVERVDWLPDGAPVTTGYIVGATGSFVGAFLAAGIALVIGIVGYVFILGRLERTEDPPPA